MSIFYRVLGALSVAMLFNLSVFAGVQDISCQIKINGEYSEEFKVGNGISFNDFDAFCTNVNGIEPDRELLFCTFSGGVKNGYANGASDISSGYLRISLYEGVGHFQILTCSE